uniref:IlGF domain-containing protein n=1 Tax=Steinernema glaseri TaxID=37863 RepID=A0A1I7Y2Z6_9BILA
MSWHYAPHSKSVADGFPDSSTGALIVAEKQCCDMVTAGFFFALLVLGANAAAVHKRSYSETIAFILRREQSEKYQDSAEYRRLKLCGRQLTDTLEDICMDGADLDKHGLSQDEISEIVTGCCQEGCCLARIAYTFCAPPPSF